MGTINAVGDSPEDILSKLISLVDNANSSLPKCNVFISNLVRRTDDRKKNGLYEKVNTSLKGSKCTQGNAVLASNFLNAIKILELGSLDSF